MSDGLPPVPPAGFALDPVNGEVIELGLRDAEHLAEFRDRLGELKRRIDATLVEVDRELTERLDHENTRSGKFGGWEVVTEAPLATVWDVPALSLALEALVAADRLSRPAAAAALEQPPPPGTETAGPRAHEAARARRPRGRRRDRGVPPRRTTAAAARDRHTNGPRTKAPQRRPGAPGGEAMSTTDLEPVSGEIERTAPLLPMGVAQAEGAMRAYQELCSSVLDSADWIGRPGEPGSFVKRSGWQKLATFYGITTELLERQVERDADGKPVRAYVLARAIAANGRHADGDGACGRNEQRFANASGRQKIEHDLPATAATRATNRAISNLIGFGAVSAEEIDTDVRAGSTAPDPPDWAADIPPDAVDRFGDNLEAILFHGPGDTTKATVEVGNAIVAYCDGVVPAACARLVKLLALALNPNPAPGVPPLDDDVTPEGDVYAAAPDVPPEEG